MWPSPIIISVFLLAIATRAPACPLPISGSISRNNEDISNPALPANSLIEQDSVIDVIAKLKEQSEFKYNSYIRLESNGILTVYGPDDAILSATKLSEEHMNEARARFGQRRRSITPRSLESEGTSVPRQITQQVVEEDKDPSTAVCKQDDDEGIPNSSTNKCEPSPCAFHKDCGHYNGCDICMSIFGAELVCQ